MAEKRAAIHREVHRPAASATWRHSHKWGTSFGDSTDLIVTRTDGGSLRIAYGKESMEVRGILVGLFAEMVADAAAWSDTPSSDVDGGAS